jgi:hypothetical protein
MKLFIKKDLLENWDGYDYYDGEYIKDNFCLYSNDKNYPTMDHKISCYYGFLIIIRFMKLIVLKICVLLKIQ